MSRGIFRNHLGRFRTAMQRGILLLLVLVLAQTWCLEGLISPLQITGSSMAPTLLGEHRELTCSACGFPFVCDAAWRPMSPRAVCPNCGSARNELAAHADLAGDRILVDRSAFVFRRPRRWEPVAFRPVQEAGKIVVKRVVGLPGEAVQIRDGDVYVNGEIARKNLQQQKELLLPVHTTEFSLPDDLPPRWTGKTPPGRWTALRGQFMHPGAVGSRSASIDWLVYRHWRRKAGPGDSVQIGPVENVFTYNQNRPYREENVRTVADLFLDFRIEQARGQGTFWIRAADGRDVFRAGINPKEKKLRVFQNEQEAGSREIACSRLAGMGIEVSLIDRQFLLALDGEVVFRRPCRPRSEPPPGASEPFAIGTQGLGVMIEPLRVFRDVYYTEPQGIGQPRDGPLTVSLGKDEFFVLGDNSYASEDSRTWNPAQAVRRRLLLGKPLVVIYPATRFQWGGLRCQIPDFSQIRAIR